MSSWKLQERGKMSLNRIIGIFWQEYYITRHSLEVLMDIFFFPAVAVLVFGFISIFISGRSTSAASYLLVGAVLWEIVYVTQYSISVGSLWNIWSRNLSNMFITPISVVEYMTAYIISGTVKAIILLFLFGLLCIPIFNFNIFQLGAENLILYFINLVLFAVTTGIMVLAAIFRYGTRIQSLAWGLIFLFQPLCATFFPLQVLPHPIRDVALLFPPTYIFEAARNSILNSGVDVQRIVTAFVINATYFILAVFFFKYMFRKARDTGQFARNEG